MKEKLLEIDTILITFEDWMHGKDGDEITRARGLLQEIMNEIIAP